MKRLIAALLAGLTLFALVGCSAGSKADSAAPKDYSQILHDARTDEENEYDMIFTKGEDGKFTAIDGYSAEYEAGQLDDEVRSILLPLKNEPLLMLILNFIPLAVGYLLKCYKFHKQGFGEAWDKGMHEAFALLKSGRLGKRPFRLKDLPNYILMELWMIWNMVPYLWYRLVIVKFDLK